METIKRVTVFLLCIAMLLFSVCPAYSDNTKVNPQGFSDENNNDNSGGTGLSGVEGAVVSALEEGESTLYRICKALFPISLVLLFITILITRNDKKVAIYAGLAGGVCLTLLGIMLVENGTILNFLQSIADMLEF